MAKGVNLSLRIGALEAKQGLDPRIRVSKYVKTEGDLEELRKQKIDQHLHHLQKTLNKISKKAKRNRV